MKLLSLFTLLFVSTSTLATVFEVKNICDDSAYFKTEVSILAPTTLSHLTLSLFDSHKIPYEGAETGINQILNTRVGLDAYEIFGEENHSMRVYGWCYSVNGVIPELLMNQVQIDPKNEDHIVWFYGYAEVYKNDWLSQCVPVQKDPQPFICGESK